jgi:hypothetical protein
MIQRRKVAMVPLLLAAAILMAAEEKKEDAPKVEGKWRIVYAEEGGRRNNTWEQKMAAVEDNTLSYESEGKKRSLKLKFGPHQTVKAEGENEYTGVYIHGQDYLCLSLNDAKGESKSGQSSGSFILILRKQRAERTEK